MFELRRPCRNCPWRADLTPYLAAERVAEIVQAPAFQCHKTVDYSSGEDEPGNRPQQCAGRYRQVNEVGDLSGFW